MLATAWVRSAALVVVMSNCVMAFAPTPASAFVGGTAGMLSPALGRQSGRTIAMSALNERDNAMPRRAMASAMIAVALGLPSLRVNAMTEEEELKKLQEEAARLQGLFDSQKKANQGIPGLKDAVKEAQKAEVGGKVEVAAPKPSSGSPEETVKTLMAALKNNDEQDSGLKTVLDFTSPENPILENTKFFFNQMKNSKYNVLLGNFDKFEIVKTDKFTEQGKQVAIVQMKVFAPFKSMMINSVPPEYMVPTTDTATSAVKINWQLSKDPKSGNWLSDTMYFQQPSQ